jgi:hypothetical protein
MSFNMSFFFKGKFRNTIAFVVNSDDFNMLTFDIVSREILPIFSKFIKKDMEIRSVFVVLALLGKTFFKLVKNIFSI